MPTITTGRTTYKAIVPAETTRGCFKKGRSTPSPATVSHASTAASGIPKPTRTIPRILAKRRIAITSLNYSPVPGRAVSMRAILPEFTFRTFVLARCAFSPLTYGPLFVLLHPFSGYSHVGTNCPSDGNCLTFSVLFALPTVPCLT